MMPLNHILRKSTAGYKLNKSQKMINHLMYMDDIKLFVKNEKQLEMQIHAVGIYSQDIGMDFGTEKSAVLIMASGKRHLTDGMELPNQGKIRTLGEKKLTPSKKWRWKMKLKKSISGERESYSWQNSTAETLSKEKNTWDVLFVRYSRPFLK